MSFWKTFGFHTVSAIDTLLESDDFTLEQLLDEEEILQETKSQNKKLIDFLCQADTLKKLVIYITQEPEEDADTKRKFKYPFLACEILASEVWALCDAFYQHAGLLDELYGFLAKEPPLNSMLASYTSRVAGVLLQKKVAETIAYMKDKKGIISSFIKHLGNSSVMDLLLKVIASEDTPDGAGILEWLCKTDLISSLVGKFDPKLSFEVHENAAQALVDIVAISVASSSSPLIAQLESDEMIKTLFGFMLGDGLNSSLLHGLSVLIELLKRHINDHHDETTTVEQLPPLLQLVVNNLEKFNNFLVNPSSSNEKNDAKLLLPSGLMEPLGFHRLKIIEFFAILARSNYKCIDNVIIKFNILNTCLDLFFRYMWNNFLHFTVEQMIQGILDGENEDMKKHLLIDCQLIKRIVEAHKENESELTKPKGVRRGYMGHLTTISAGLLQTASADPGVEKLLSEIPEWHEYVKGPLAQTRERESRRLADYIATDDFNEEPEENDEFDNDYQNDRDFNGEDDDDDDDDDDRVVQARIEDDDDDDDDVVEGPVVSREEVWVEREIQENDEEEEGKNPSSHVEVSV